MLRSITLLLLLGVASTAAAADGEPSAAEAAIYRRIDQLRRATLGLRVDGLEKDWSSFPQMSDPRGDAVGGDTHRDLVAAAIAPTETDLWIMLRTAGTPSTDPWAFVVFVDLLGDRGSNFRIDWQSPLHLPTLRLLDEKGNPGDSVLLPHADAAIRRVVEMRIPYADIAAALPPEKKPLVSGKLARPWVRIETQTWDAVQKKVIDYGPSVASFRLLKTPYPLDTPLAERPDPPRAIPLPVHGQWYVLQGPLGSFSHKNVWACDFIKLDATGRCCAPLESKSLTDYHAFGQPVYAPIEGFVLRARNDVDDSPVRGAFNNPSMPTNGVMIRSADGFAVDMLHLRKGSVTVASADQTTAGRQVGAVGNSGATDVPHLHVAAWTGWRWQWSCPLSFTKVRVGLNPVANDPWVRDLPSWEPRQGYFVGTGE